MTRVRISSALCVGAISLALAPFASAQVFISGIFINPPGSADSTKEFVALTGTPGRKLDGYGFALIYGRQTPYYTVGQIPPQPADEPEIDEFFSLDGLSLGKNGILLLGIGQASDYPLVIDTNFANWNNIWDGPLDVPGKLNNDGSTTAMLVRNRPSMTEADPFNPAGPTWVKDGSVDAEITFNVMDPYTATISDLVGDGKFDLGGTNSIGTPLLDLLGTTTPTIADDLEVVDEVSFEDSHGWEYDLDGRKADLGATQPGYNERKVHQLGDPQGFDPDVLIRVDYRTKGPGYPPQPGATGQLPNGNNWQDTATEQWIRGESIQALSGGLPPFPAFFLDNHANVDPNAQMPYLTYVPRWLNDGIGVDYSFALQSYQILGGQANALAIPFIPGDADRDGDCDADDIQKIVGLFGTDPGLFINSYPTAPHGDSGDPATQTRPWDVDGSGDNGIDPTDLEWALDFQGDTTGHVRGVTYDATGPATNGVYLNDGSNTTLAVDAQVAIACAPSQSQLRINDVVEVTVRGRISAGANTTPGQENGIQQFVNDLLFSAPGVLKVESIEAALPFKITNPSVIDYVTGGAAGANRVNGYTTSFTQGLSGPTPLYKVKLRAVAAGTTSFSINQSFDPRFLASAPLGLKIGHTNNFGNAGAVAYPSALSFTVTSTIGGLIAEYGTGCIGTGGFTPHLAGSGCATPGGSLTLDITQGKPGAVPNLFIGLGNTSGALNPHCSIQILPILPTPVVLFPLPGVGAGNGSLSLPGLVIPPTVPIGISTYLQMLFADPAGFGGISGTNPLKITFGF